MNEFKSLWQWFSRRIFVICIVLLLPGPLVHAEDNNPEKDKVLSLSKQGRLYWAQGAITNAMQTLQKAVEAGEIDGTWALADIYHNGAEYALAFPLYQKCARAEIIDCQIWEIYYLEKGLAGKKDWPRAQKLLLDLVKKNEKRALVYYSEALIDGRMGFKPSPDKALKLLQALAVNGDRTALNLLKDIFRKGRGEIKPDPVQYRHWDQVAREMKRGEGTQ